MAEPEQSVLTKQDAWDLSETVISETIQGLFYGLECLFMMAALYKLLGRGLRNSITRRLLVAAILIMFSCSTATIVCNLLGDMVQIKGLSDSDYDPTPAFRKFQIISTLSTRISYLLGDVIVVWRAWILFDEKPVFRLALATCLMTTFCSVVVNIAFSLKAVLNNNFRTQPGVRLILPATLFLTNVVSTSFVVYKTWYYRRSIKAYIFQKNRKSQVEKVLILLVESGFFYSFLWILSLISISNPQYYDFAVFYGTIIPHAAGIYPTAIILLTASQKTYCDTTLQGLEVPSQTVEAPQGRSLRFAANAHNRREPLTMLSTDDDLSRHYVNGGQNQTISMGENDSQSGLESKTETTAVV